MDVWGTILLGINILLLLAGWLLFQQAKSDLTARAAQMPVLSEVKALQKSVAALLEQLKMESIQTSAQLDARCAEAKDLIAAIDRRLEEAPTQAARPIKKRSPRVAQVSAGTESVAADADPRKAQVYALSDDGWDEAEIAAETGFPVGEVELILSLRPKADETVGPAP
jgi:hypothetical protein